MLLGSTEGFVSKGGTSPLWGSRLLRVADKSARIIRCNAEISLSLGLSRSLPARVELPCGGGYFLRLPTTREDVEPLRRLYSRWIWIFGLEREVIYDDFGATISSFTLQSRFSILFFLFIIVISRLRELKQIYDFSKAHERQWITIVS